MKIAIYGRITPSTNYLLIEELLSFFAGNNIEFSIYKKYSDQLLQSHEFFTEELIKRRTFSEANEIADFDMVYSFGGDGTILHAATLIGTMEIPIFGVNFGRLGFLASVPQSDLIGASRRIFKGDYFLDKRSVIKLITEDKSLFDGKQFALNEISILKSLTNEMITIHVHYENHYLNSYWGDGLIISTPTGSTAYSLSCGGPIIMPQSNSFVLTPVAPHSLTVRPLVIPDFGKLSFELESRSGEAMISLDYKTETIPNHQRFRLQKSTHSVNLVRLNESNYFNTLRSSLMWGMDIRNK